MDTKNLSDSFLDSYIEYGAINHIDGINLPSRSTIIAITKDLLDLLLPGYFSKTPLNSQNLAESTSLLLEKIKKTFLPEIEKSLEYQFDGSKSAEQILDGLLSSLPPLREILQWDIDAAFQGDPAARSVEEIILAYPGFEAVLVQRISHLLHKEGVALIPRMMTEWAHSHTGIDIHPGASIGTHFFIDHGTGTVIGETCTIGDHVKIYHGVTLGARSTSGGQKLFGKRRHPSIEDNVTIYPGVTILGGDTLIGENSIIGGNVWITHSVPKNSLVTLEDMQLHVRSRSVIESNWEI